MRTHFPHSIQNKKTPSAVCMPRLLLRGITIHIFLTGIFGSALAQDAGRLLQEQQWRQKMQKPPESSPESQSSPSQQTAPVQQKTSKTFLVKELRFSGKIELLPVDERKLLADEIQNKRVSITELQSLADEATSSLQKRGHLLARVLLPSQDVTEGFVTLDIADGTLEKIDIERGKEVRIREDLLRAIAEKNIHVNNVSKEKLEEALLRMNDLPGVAARGSIGPGTASDTSRLAIKIEQAPVFSASLRQDNYGRTDASRAQSNALATLTDLTGLGDQTRFTGSFSEAQKFAQADTSIPLRASGFTARASYAYLTYRDIDGVGHVAGLEGFANYLAAGLDYDLIRSRRRNLRLSTMFNWKVLVDDSIAGRLQNKRVWSNNFSLVGDLRDESEQSSLTNWSLDWTWGDLDLSRVPSAQAADAATLKTQGNYHRVSSNLSRVQSLSRNLSLFTHLYGQWANKNLDSSEDFALGGPYGVRGWPVGEGRGDMGALGTVELRYDAPIPQLWGKIQFSALLDGGRVWVNKNSNNVPSLTACGCNAYSLKSAGVGMRWVGENLSIAAIYAQGIGSNPGRSTTNDTQANGQTRNRQFWLQGESRF